jgi:TetR/AcrR family transcriptional repressor of nem operon
MRYSQKQIDTKHQAIIDAASQMFRESGFDGVRVADVMHAAGLTHGAFPAHFSSKDELALASLERILKASLEKIDQASKTSESRNAFFENYLSKKHRNNPSTGCPMVALSTEIHRKNGEVQNVFTNYFSDLIDKLSNHFFNRRRDPRVQAIANISMMVGALTLARAVSDKNLSDEILQAARSQIGTTAR